MLPVTAEPCWSESHFGKAVLENKENRHTETGPCNAVVKGKKNNLHLLLFPT